MTCDTLTQYDTMCHIQAMHDLLRALDILAISATRKV